MRFQILVDAEEFWQDLKHEILGARENVYGQTMSFEGDETGEMFSEALRMSSAPDKRLVLDSYIRAIINDKFLYTPANLLNRALRAEVRQTHDLIRRNRQAGIEIKFANPLGLFFWRLPLRNHKKLVVIDNKIAYIGGINFCDHNFYWHDLMLKIRDKEIVSILKEDFITTWGGRNAGGRHKFPGMELHLYDGKRNPDLFQPMLDLVDSAKEEIFVQSPYLTFPFIEALGQARQRGAEVKIVCPDANNWGILRSYLLSEANRFDLDMRLYPDRMTHLKAMLIDNKTLVLGSTNFDFLSYLGHVEIAAVLREKAVIQSFREKVLQPDWQKSRELSAEERSLNEPGSRRWLTRLDGIVRFLNRRPAQSWPVEV